MSASAHVSLPAALLSQAAAAPNAVAIHFVGEDGAEQPVTYAQIASAMSMRAAALARAGARTGDVVVLVMPHTMALIEWFWGALGFGALPTIFPYLTPKLDAGTYATRVHALAAEAGARIVITSVALEPAVRALVAGLDCRVIAADERVDDVGSPLPALPPGDDAPALLQYSSGTTGLQKGIVLSHRAVLAHLDALSEAYAVRADDVVVSWLPLYHDMGLVIGFLLPLVKGIPTVLMSPFHWVRQPGALFRAFSRYRGTLCWMPNFAFNHCARAVAERELAGCDLSAVRVIVNGSEPVRLDSLRMFAQRFAPYGLRAQVLSAAYGLAENVVGVSTSPHAEGYRVDWVNQAALQVERRAAPAEPDAPGATPVISCGRPFPGTEVRVLDDEGQALNERRVGELVIRSPYMLRGYFRRPDLSAEAFHGGWFRTGDMGYIAAGEVFVCGRKKDMIISGGRNIYPDDLEAIASGVPGVHAGRAVAFGVSDARAGTERIVIVCELDAPPGAENKRAVELELRRRVARELDVAPADVRLVGEHDWIIKTSNGKLARSANRDKYLRAFGGPAG
ncbi:MAG: AMP-binding protein [Chloroflexi bacterium]|nr:AMP-binding protein [Chloroflexota bacterium]